MNPLEIAISAVIVVILLIILGVNVMALIAAFYALLALVLLCMVVFFCGCCIFLLTSKKMHGEFVCFDSSKHYETAVYRCEGGEYKNIFPAERIMREIIYREGERVLFVHKGCAADMHTVLIIVLGLLLSLPSLAVTIYQINAVIR